MPIQALVSREKPKEKGAESGEEPEPGGGEIEEGVYLLDGDKVTFQKVETGLTGSLEIEVKSGLEPGREIVTGPFRALRELKDGDKVVVKKEPEEAKK